MMTLLIKEPMVKSKTQKLWFGYDVVSESGPFPRPQRIEFWNNKDFNGLAPDSPFHYKSDALLGLSLYLLNPQWKNQHMPEAPTAVTEDLWKSLEPHHELFLRAQPRVMALRSQLKPVPNARAEEFARIFTETLAAVQDTQKYDLDSLLPLTDAIDQLEVKNARPLLYDFNLQFTPEVRTRMLWLHSVLFHLRTLVAMDYNAYIQDATHEAVRVDSITDYLARAEYVANDALLYWTFKRLRDKIPASAATPLEEAFLTYSHNGAYLIESLPKSFLSALRADEMTETLYLVQMDWLLGTDAGLLFRLREELYGLSEGYDKVFWPDQVSLAPRATQRLSVQCELSETQLFKAA